MNDVKVSVIVPMRNCARTVADALQSIFEQEYPEPWELVVVDNGSTDQSVAVARSCIECNTNESLASTMVLSYTERYGHASPRNFGAWNSRGDVLVFCDADDVCAPGWLAAIAGAAQSDGLAASRHVTLGSGQPTVDVRQAPELPSRKLGFLVASTAGMGVTRELFECLQGFDGYFESGGADADFSIRAARNAGVVPVLAPRAIYFFRPRGSANASLSRGYRYGRSQARLAFRHEIVDELASTRWTVLLRRFVGILRRAPRLLGRTERSNAAAHIGWIVGRSVWSIKLMRRPF